MVNEEHKGHVPRGRREPNGRQWGHGDMQPIYLEMIYFFVLFCQFSFVWCVVFVVFFWFYLCFFFLSSHHKHCIDHPHESKKTHIPIPIETVQ